MKPEEFISLESGMPIDHTWVAVTNNIRARDAYGNMSHVWITKHVATSREGDGFVVFDAADRKIVGLTHYKYI